MPQDLQAVFDFLDVMANHEPFTDHMLTNWRYSGPPSGVGSRAQVTAIAGGRSEEVEIEVIAATPPRRIVERNIGAKGRRVATGTYELEPLADGGTLIAFEYAWEQAPLAERLMGPLLRRYLNHRNELALARLAEQLQGTPVAG